MGRLNSEAGASPALSRNCNPLQAESQDDYPESGFHKPRGKEVEASILMKRCIQNLPPVLATGFFIPTNNQSQERLCVN
jgi:hypothetical protein